jgi:hypothetical protein
MKTISIRNTEASHRFIRSYMAANDLGNLNVLKYEPLNHGHGARASALNRSVCHLPLDLTGDKPRQPQGRLTFQPFAALSKIQAATDSGWVGVEETKAFFEARGVNYPK